VLIALVALGEPFRPVLLLGTGLIVFGSGALAHERRRPAQFRVAGLALAIACGRFR
jgi:drug/metabolite transporter (DMT)-like permease